MPDPTDNLQEVRRLVKQLGIKVETVEDLQRVLAAVSASYNPDALRVRTIRTISTTAISVSMGAAGIVSFFALANPDMGKMAAQGFPPVFIVLIVMWAVAGVVSFLAVLVGLRWLRHSMSRSTTGPPPLERPGPLPGSDKITTPENLNLPREVP